VSRLHCHGVTAGNMRRNNANANSHGNGNGNGYSDGKRNADGYGNGYSKRYGEPDGNRYGNAVAVYPDAQAVSDASAAPDPLRLTRTLKIRELASETREFPASRWINDLAVAGVSLANPSHLQPRRMPLWSRQ